MSEDRMIDHRAGKPVHSLVFVPAMGSHSMLHRRPKPQQYCQIRGSAGNGSLSSKEARSELLRQYQDHQGPYEEVCQVLQPNSCYHLS